MLKTAEKNVPSKSAIPSLHMIKEGEREDGVAGIKRRRRDLSSDGVRDLVTTSGRGRLKEDLESSMWRRLRDFSTTPSQRYLYIYKIDFRVLILSSYLTNKIACGKFLIKNEEEFFTVAGDGVGIKPDGKDEKDPKEDPAYYPTDRGNNDDDESSNDDDDDDYVEKDEEDKEEEEHLASADPSDVSTDDLVPSG
uniref:Uncharacterized protein n=1 Tax=Tanacetum cinerariifolium TaxID=118510 RepID=A0A699H075_TANCI|nr:hypothetical protein [Tanacetum cinerariifolium]